MHGETPFGEKILGSFWVESLRAPSQSFARNFLQLIREYGLELARCQRKEDSNFDTTRRKLQRFRAEF